MNAIVKENFDKNISINDVLEKLHDNITFNKEFINIFKGKKEENNKNIIYSINSLVPIFEYLEELFWPEFKKSISEDYFLPLSEKSKKYVIEYFNKIKNQNKLINIQDFVLALRRLISRYLTIPIQETNIKYYFKLNFIIDRDEFWSKKINENNEKDIELDNICQKDILVGNAMDLYNILDGDSFLSKAFDKNENLKKEDN